MLCIFCMDIISISVFLRCRKIFLYFLYFIHVVDILYIVIIIIYYYFILGISILCMLYFPLTLCVEPIF